MVTETMTLGQSHTIEAILRYKNPLVEKGSQLEALVELFNNLNEFKCTKLGQQVIIPIIEEYQVKI